MLNCVVADFEEVSDYLDVDMVNLYEEDFHTIGQIRKLSNTAMDKLTFTVRNISEFFFMYVKNMRNNYVYVRNM